MPAPRVVVVYAKPETGPKAIFTDALTQLLVRDRFAHVEDVLSITSSPRIAATRNQLVDAFLRHPSGAEYLLMLDDDMAFKPDLVERLLEAADPVERPIVSGLYFGGKHHGVQIPHIYLLNDKGDGFHPIEGLKGGWGAVVRIHAAGAGCLLMHRDVLVRIGDAFAHTGFPWFSEAAAEGREYGEDIVFCLRAHSLGIPIHAHTGVILGHVKPGIIDEHTYADYLMKRELHGGGQAGEDAVRAEHRKRIRLALPDEPAPVPAPRPKLEVILPPDERDRIGATR